MRTFFEGRKICTRATADTETSGFFRQLIDNGLGFETAERLLKCLKDINTFFEGREICTRATADTETSVFFRQLIDNGLGFETAERLLKCLKDINTWEK